MSETAPRRVRVGHSPDPDDAFMFFGIAAGKVDTEGFVVDQVLEDIETLNRRALAGELEVTALSIHAYAHLADRYALMPCGASMGDGYGPMLVAREPFAAEPESLGRLRFAVPGTLTSAFLALKLYLGKEPEHEVVPFDAILEHVHAGASDLGLVIHEGQLTYSRQGLHRILDLGTWWKERTEGLPLPLGGNGVRKDLGAETMRSLTRVLKRSIAYGLDHRKEALAYAADFGRGLDGALTDRFVGMYVNELTLDYGDRGREGIRRFLAEGIDRGYVPAFGGVEFVESQ